MGRQYLAYDGNIMGGTQPMMISWAVLGLWQQCDSQYLVYRQWIMDDTQTINGQLWDTWYSACNGRLLAVLFAQVDCMTSMKGHGGLWGQYSLYEQYKCEWGAMASSKVEWQATSGTKGMVRLCKYRTRPKGVVHGLTTTVYGVA